MFNSLHSKDNCIPSFTCSDLKELSVWHPPSFHRHSPPLFHGFNDIIFPSPPFAVNFGLNIQPMETLNHILASFDIFQVILSAFPQIFTPILHAFTGMLNLLSDMAARGFATHPGLITGTVIFTLVYAAWSGLARLTRSMVTPRSNSGHRS